MPSNLTLANLLFHLKTTSPMLTLKDHLDILVSIKKDLFPFVLSSTEKLAKPSAVAKSSVRILSYQDPDCCFKKALGLSFDCLTKFNLRKNHWDVTISWNLFMCNFHIAASESLFCAKLRTFLT